MELTKRKRLVKTSSYQYEIYLEKMENDHIFRTGSINPSVDPGYVQKTWECMVIRLNSCDNGPVLSVTEWKKRFTDWKNSTRSKYRKIVESSHTTGGGPSTDIKLLPLEERGLNVWGRVAVTGSKNVLVTGGLSVNKPDVFLSEMNLPIDTYEIVTEYEVEEANQNLHEAVHGLATNDTHAFIKTPSKKPRKQEKNLKSIGEELLVTYKENVTNATANLSLEDKKIALKVNKFKFEVAKFQYFNKDFVFEFENI